MKSLYLYRIEVNAMPIYYVEDINVFSGFERYQAHSKAKAA